MVAVIAFLGMGLIVPVTHCVQGSIIADTFPAKVRYSGSSLILQSGAILGGGLAPMIATALLDATGSSVGVTWYLAGVCTISLVGAIRSEERRGGKGWVRTCRSRWTPES